MLQRFIELGEGYSDIYELIELANANQHRLAHLMALHTTIEEKHMTSLVVVLQPTDPGEFRHYIFVVRAFQIHIYCQINVLIYLIRSPRN